MRRRTSQTPHRFVRPSRRCSGEDSEAHKLRRRHQPPVRDHPPPGRRSVGEKVRSKSTSVQCQPESPRSPSASVMRNELRTQSPWKAAAAERCSSKSSNAQPATIRYASRPAERTRGGRLPVHQQVGNVVTRYAASRREWRIPPPSKSKSTTEPLGKSRTVIRAGVSWGHGPPPLIGKPPVDLNGGSLRFERNGRDLFKLSWADASTSAADSGAGSCECCTF